MDTKMRRLRISRQYGSLTTHGILEKTSSASSVPPRFKGVFQQWWSLLLRKVAQPEKFSTLRRADEIAAAETAFSGSKKAASRPVPAFRFAPIRVREKRMNTHRTRAGEES